MAQEKITKMKKYYIVPQNIVTEYQNYQINEFRISFTQIITGEWVVNTGCGEDIFSMINWSILEQRDLYLADFPLSDSL